MTFKVKVSLRSIQQTAMRSVTFDESKCPDTMKVSRILAVRTNVSHSSG
jgi:hypothetical protein